MAPDSRQCVISPTAANLRLFSFAYFFLAGAEGLAACFALLWLADRFRATVPGSPLLAKNSPQDCFLDAQTLSGSSPHRKKSRTSATLFLAGAEGLEPSARGFGAKRVLHNSLMQMNTSELSNTKTADQMPTAYPKKIYLTKMCLNFVTTFRRQNALL